MERSELKVGEGVKRLRAGRLTPHRPVGVSRRVTDDRMLWKGHALMRFAHFPTINSILSNAPDFRLQSRHVVRVPMGNRRPMNRRDRASSLSQSNEGCDQSQGGMPRTPTARGPAVAEFDDVSPTKHQRRGVTGV
jgi:hypothetical protein